MTLPNPIMTGSAIAQLLDPAGRPLKGNVIIRYNRNVILADGTTPPATVIARSKIYALDDDGNVNCDGIILRDSPGLRWDMVGLGAIATFALTDQDGNKRPRGEVPFSLSMAHPIKDLTEVAPVDDSGDFPTFPEFNQVPDGTGATVGWYLKITSLSPLIYGWHPVSGGGGGGSVNTVNDIEPDDTGNVELGVADIPGAYEVPTGGIPGTDLTAQIRASLGLADSAVQPDDLAGFVPSSNVARRVYATDGSGNQITLAFSATAPTASTIAQRNGDGGLTIETLPASDPDAAATDAINRAFAALTFQPVGSYASAADLDNVFAIANGAIQATQKGAANGVATLDSGGKIPQAQLPAIAITEYLGTSANQAAMLAKVGQMGDFTTRTDLGTTWIITGADPTQLSSWTQLTYPASPVQSVFGRTGAVTGSPADVGATVTGAAVMTAADAAAARTAIGAGTSSLAIGTSSSTAKRGDYQPASTDISDASAIGRTLLTAATVTAERNALLIYDIAAGGSVAGIPVGATVIEAT